jgi:hypothetical protein
MRKIPIVSYHFPPDASTVVRPEDHERLEAKLKEMYTQFQRGVLAVEESSTNGIHRELTKVELTRKLAHLLN